MLGGNGVIVKSFDKMAKSFVIQMTEKNTHIVYPKQQTYLNQAAQSTEFQRMESPAPLSVI